MAENKTVARPYAEAVFKLAEAKNSFDDWQSMLYGMAVACQDPYYLGFLKNSASQSEAAEQLIGLMKDLVNDEGKNFIRLLGENGRFEVLPEIYLEFRKLRDTHDKIMTVQLTSARPLPEQDVTELKQKLSSKYGCNIRLIQHEDPSLIGGAVLKIGDEVIDATVRSSLVNLSSTLR